MLARGSLGARAGALLGAMPVRPGKVEEEEAAADLAKPRGWGMECRRRPENKGGFFHP